MRHANDLEHTQNKQTQHRPFSPMDGTAMPGDGKPAPDDMERNTPMAPLPVWVADKFKGSDLKYKSDARTGFEVEGKILAY